MTSKTEEIYETVLPAMRENGIEDTVRNRLHFLMGIKEAWIEDKSDSLEKTLYQIALNSEIFRLQMQMRFPTVKL